MAESIPEQEPRRCYLCGCVKDPRIILIFSEPVCRTCVYYIGSSRIELEIRKKDRDPLNDSKRKFLDFTRSLPSTSGTASQQKQPISRSSSMPVMWQQYPLGSMVKTIVNKADKPGLSGCFSQVKLELVYPDISGEIYAYDEAIIHSSARALSLNMDYLAPHVLESQNSSNSNPDKQQQGIQNKIPFYICWICKQGGIETLSIQCPVVPAHTFCIQCTSIYIRCCIKLCAVTHCPSGHKRMSSGMTMIWRVPPTGSSTITTAKEFWASQGLEQQNSSKSSSNQQGNENKIKFICWTCKRQGTKDISIQCPLVPSHIFCKKCADINLRTELLNTGINCPSGKKCASSEIDMPWKFTKEQLNYIDSFTTRVAIW